MFGLIADLVHNRALFFIAVAFTMSSAKSPWLALERALESVLNNSFQQLNSQSVSLSDALGMICAQNIVAPVFVPPWDNSAMDGYAVIAEQAAEGHKFDISSTLTAGMKAETPLLSGTAVRIMTGAMMPQGANAVVMQENTQRNEDGTITVVKSPKAGENIRRKGADIEQGETVVQAGTRLSAAHIMLLSSLGFDTVTVKQPLKVGLLATGDELAAPGTAKKENQIYESNKAGIAALLSPFKPEIIDYGIASDSPVVIRSIFEKASSEVDLLISSGGVSVGDADFVKDVLDDLGNIGFWKVAIKPGKPFAFGTIGKTLFCGLPGNPVSTYVTTEQLVVPLLRHLQGESDLSPTHRLTLPAKVLGSYKRRAGRKEFVRAHWSYDTNNELTVSPLQKQSSGVMSTVTQANCYLILESDCTSINDGDTVMIQPFTLNT